MKRILFLLCLALSVHLSAQTYFSQQSSEVPFTLPTSGLSCLTSTTNPCHAHLAWSYAGVPAGSGYSFVDYCIQKSNTVGGTRFHTVTPSGGGTPVLEAFCSAHAEFPFLDDSGVFPGQTVYYSVAVEMFSTGGTVVQKPLPPTGLTAIVH